MPTFGLAASSGVPAYTNTGTGVTQHNDSVRATSAMSMAIKIVNTRDRSPAYGLWLVACCVFASWVELNAEPSDQSGGFDAKDTGHFGCCYLFGFCY